VSKFYKGFTYLANSVCSVEDHISVYFFKRLVVFKDKEKLSNLRIATWQQPWHDRKENVKPPVYIPVVTVRVQQNELQFSYIWGRADKYLARLTSRYLRTDSIVSLERGVCSCAELQVFSCYRRWKEACQATRAISTISRRELLSSFSLQGRTPKEIHAILTVTLGEHAPSYATIKNWVAQFKHGDFSTYFAPRSGRPKTINTPEIIYQIHELILEERWSSAKSIAEQLGISRERVGSIIHEDLDKRKLSAKWVPKWLNADRKRQRCHSPEKLLEFFRQARSKWFPVRRNCWPWTKPGYITMTRKQSNNEWSDGVVPHHAPKIPSAKIRWKSSSLGFLGSIRRPPHWLSSKGPNYQRGVLIISAGAIEGHFERKTLQGGRSPRGSWSYTRMSSLTGHLQPRRKWPTWTSIFLIARSIFRIWPRRTPLCYLDWKKQLKVRHFSSDAEVIAAAETWLDGQNSDFFLNRLQN